MESRGYAPNAPRFLGRTALGVVLPAAVLLTWQLLSRLGIISELLFPAPSTIWQSFLDLASSGELWPNLRISLLRVLSGFLLGGTLGFAFGLAVGLFRKTEKALDPTIQMIRMIPSLAIVPLFILWFGIGEESKVLVIAKAAFFPVYVNTFAGIRSVDNRLYEVTRVLGYSRMKQAAKLALPGALPHVLLGARLSLGLSWLGLVVAELIASSSGIGYMMSDARQFADTPVVFVGILLFAGGGLLGDSLLLLLQRRLLKWKEG